MLRVMFRLFFTLAMTLSLALGIFAGGAGVASAASDQPTAASGYNPVASVPTGIGYCYPSGYNRAGWRCGWRLAMYPYNMGSCYYNNCGGYYYGNYGNCYNGYNGCNGYYGYNNYGYNNYYPYAVRTDYPGDYGGQPRYQYPYPCYYNPYGYCGWR
jgi:hypothetical protein